MTLETKIAIFNQKQIRKTLFNNEWWFSIIDIISVLTESDRPRKYWNDLKKKLFLEGYNELSEKIGQLRLESSDGKLYQTDCANTETIFRIIQAIPSPKAEPFKKWLAKVGYERIQEIENPELATQRTRMLYKAKGYSDDWIEKRMRGIAIREELTEEWKGRGVAEQRDYSILTAEICKSTFGMTPSEYKEFKNLQRENLRDHMTDLELIFSMLGERVTTEITRNEDSEGFQKLKSDAFRGGKIAGDARNNLEKELGRSALTPENYLEGGDVVKKLKSKSSKKKSLDK